MNGKISVVINGEAKECTLLFTANDEKANKEYAVYTDNSLNGEGKANVYLARRQGNQLLPVSDTEKKELEKLVKIVQEEICNEN